MPTRTTIVIALVFVIGLEATQRFAHPELVQGGIVIVSALVGVGVNDHIAPGLRSQGANLNIRAAALHAEHVMRNLESVLGERFGIGPTTVQVEFCHFCVVEADHLREHNHSQSKLARLVTTVRRRMPSYRAA